ncbi:MAG: apolipoprotein N-acyltransferase [Pyrinomonadaceae bacterium]
MKLAAITRVFPSWRNLLFAAVAAVLLILAFPDFEYWFLAWFALVPLMWAIEREKASTWRSFVLGWLFGTIFFFGTCWWLTFAPITYAAFPPWLAYSGMVFVALAVGVFPAIFAAILSVLLRRFGAWAFLAAPFVWVFTEFLRYWVTGNNWNAIGYSQAFVKLFNAFPAVAGIYGMGFAITALNSILLTSLIYRKSVFNVLLGQILAPFSLFIVTVIGFSVASFSYWEPMTQIDIHRSDQSQMIALQPNIPMTGLDQRKLNGLRDRQMELAELELRKLDERVNFMVRNNQKAGLEPPNSSRPPTTVILPESPMNFMYNDDREFQQFIGDFARRNNVSVLFNAAEPDATNGKYFNSAVMVGPDGKEAAQYDKIILLPFGEAVPPFLEGIVPGFVGNFSYGREYDILPVGDAKAGVMICFESHFGQLSRRYVQDGADVIIEMTNDGYLGPTPVLRQHLANAVFRAVETNRPVLRVTNVGISAYINEKGEVLDATKPYQEDTRVWSVSKSDGSQTFYVKYGDWFAWLCSLVTLGLLVVGFRGQQDGKRNSESS